jgi:hypothetical protein
MYADSATAIKTSKIRSYVLFLLVCLTAVNLSAQDTIFLNNPSFEDTPRHSKVPQGWINCGFKNESPPDVGPTYFFRAKTQPSHGQTHLMMVTRDNGTWERIGNLLSSPLQAGRCYAFSMDLASSPVYLSVSRVTAKGINFNLPIRLRLWGATSDGLLQELLAVSEPVDHESWQNYRFQLCPLATHPLLVLEAMYSADAVQPYGGNIMLDNCSALILTEHAQRDDMRLKEWNAETIPPFNASAKVISPKKDLAFIDTMQLIPYMEDIERGRVDIGLSDLATYAKGFTHLPWTIVVTAENFKASKQQVQLLRKRIKAMGLKPYLKVKLAGRLPPDFRYLTDQLGVRG